MEKERSQMALLKFYDFRGVKIICVCVCVKEGTHFCWIHFILKMSEKLVCLLRGFLHKINCKGT